jgi:hypothetical protein
MNFRNRLICYGEELLTRRPNPKLEDLPMSASATAYSIYSQLHSISGGRLLHPQSEDAPCRGYKGPTHTWRRKILIYIYICQVENSSGFIIITNP